MEHSAEKDAPCGALWRHCAQLCIAPCDHPDCERPHPYMSSGTRS